MKRKKDFHNKASTLCDSTEHLLFTIHLSHWNHKTLRAAKGFKNSRIVVLKRTRRAKSASLILENSSQNGTCAFLLRRAPASEIPLATNSLRFYRARHG